MLKFGSSSAQTNAKLNTLINSLEDLKQVSKKYSQIQAKAYSDLHEWAVDSQNSALQDITGKLTSLYYKLDVDLNQDKLQSLKNITLTFKKFKEYDAKRAKLAQATKNSEKHERKCLNDIRKCPASKSIRDAETRFAQAKQQKECAELAAYNYSQEIDATKTILFKTNMERLNAALCVHNEAERVLLHAQQALLEKIPDVSNEEVDDICEIKYKQFDETHLICTQAKKKLNRLSSSPNIAARGSMPTELSNSISKIAKKLQKTRISCPHLQPNLKAPEKVKVRQAPRVPDAINLYPSLDQIMQEQPPTYSDSESNFTACRSSPGGGVIGGNDDGVIIISPSAPTYSQTFTDVTDSRTVAKTPQTRQRYNLRNR
jgi:hypothetical protein